MASQVDIANLALAKLAQDVPIASFDEQSKEARLFARMFDHYRDVVLSERIWPFALKHVALAVDAETALLGWGYRYAYPEDALQILAVTSESGVRGLHWDNRENYEIVGGDQGQSIVTDTPEAYVIYTARVDDPSRFSPMFVDALACKLALEAARPLKGELGYRMKPELVQDYEWALSKASANAQNESHDSYIATTPSLSARG